MKVQAKGQSIKTEQAGAVFYGLKFEANIEKFDMKLVGKFSMPTRDSDGHWIMTSINEHVRIKCNEYLSKFELGYKKAGDDHADYKSVNSDMLHGAVMKILADAIDSINSNGEPLFDIDIYMKKNKEKELENENMGIDKRIKVLSYEIEAKKMAEQKMKDILRQYNVESDYLASVKPSPAAGNVSSASTIPNQPVKQPTKQPAKKKGKGLQIGSLKFN